MSVKSGKKQPGAPPAGSTPPTRAYDPVLALLINAFVLRQLARIREAFDGDILAAIVLGEVAHHNLRRVPGIGSLPLEEVNATLTGGDQVELTNAYSISAATGIPYETTRRRVAALVERGWLLRFPNGELSLAPAARQDLGAVTAATIEDFLETARRALVSASSRDT